MNCQNPNTCRTYRRCSNYTGAAIGFLTIVFAFAIGVIIGANFYETFLPVLAAVVAFAAAILVLIIALLIYWHISKTNNC